MGQLWCLPPLDVLLSTEGACLKLDNQKNGWNGVHVYQPHNGDLLRCPMWALARRVIHMCNTNVGARDYLSSDYIIGARNDVAQGGICLSTSHLLDRATQPPVGSH